MITCKVLNNIEFFESVYGNGGSPNDKTIFKRIKYLLVSDFDRYSKLPSYFVVLKENETIIGVAKIAHYSSDNKTDNEYSLGYLSIDINHRNKGYTRLMVDTMFKYLKEINLHLRTSSYTYVGFIKLRHILNHYSKQYNVTFFDKSDNDSLITCKEMYDSDLVEIR